MAIKWYSFIAYVTRFVHALGLIAHCYHLLDVSNLYELGVLNPIKIDHSWGWKEKYELNHAISYIIS